MVFIDALASKGEMQEFCRAVPGTPKMVKNVVYELDLMKMHKIRQGHIECDSWLRAKDARWRLTLVDRLLCATITALPV